MPFFDDKTNVFTLVFGNLENKYNTLILVVVSHISHHVCFSVVGILLNVANMNFTLQAHVKQFYMTLFLLIDLHSNSSLYSA